MKGPLLDKLQSKLTQPVVKPDAVGAASRLVKVPQKPDRYALLSAFAVGLVLSDPKYRHLMPPNTLPVMWGYLKNVMPVDKVRDSLAIPAFRENKLRWENRTFPGLSTHIVLRKRRIEEHVRKQLQAGIKQVVNFGAGYDTLCTRLSSEYPDVQFFELDLPSTQKPKTDTLKSTPKNLHFVGLDLREPHLEKIMRAHESYDGSKRTYFIAEGLFCWLDEDDVDQIFGFIADNSGQRSILAFSFLPRGLDGKTIYPEASLLSDLVLKINKVQFEFGLNMESLTRFLNDRYCGLMEVLTAQELRDEAPKPIPPAKTPVRSESLAFAELVYET